MKHRSVNPRHASLCNNPVNINDYQYLIIKVAGYLASTHPSVDARELITIGYLALNEAGMQYDPERNAAALLKAALWPHNDRDNNCIG